MVIRSTVPPGTVEDVTAILKAPLEGLGLDVTVAMCPEFLREGTGIADFYAPPYTVIGSSDLRAIDLVSRLLSFVDAPLRIVHPRTAEALKYAANAFHATKVSFANELGRVFSRVGVDSREVMELFCEDEFSTSHLGISGRASHSAVRVFQRTFVPCSILHARKALTYHFSRGRSPATGSQLMTP